MRPSPLALQRGSTAACRPAADRRSPSGRSSSGIDARIVVEAAVAVEVDQHECRVFLPSSVISPSRYAAAVERRRDVRLLLVEFARAYPENRTHSRVLVPSASIVRSTRGNRICVNPPTGRRPLTSPSPPRRPYRPSGRRCGSGRSTADCTLRSSVRRVRSRRLTRTAILSAWRGLTCFSAARAFLGFSSFALALWVRLGRYGVEREGVLSDPNFTMPRKGRSDW